MRYRIEYAGDRCCNFINGRDNLIKWLKRQKSGTVADVRKVYKNGSTDSVFDSYRQYIKPEHKEMPL